MQNIFQLVGKIRFLKTFGARLGTGEIWKGKKVLCVAGDLGGWHAAAVVLGKLADSGADISVIFTGPSRHAYEENCLDVDIRFLIHKEEVNAVGAIHELPLRRQLDVVIVAPSQSKDGNEETVKIVKQLNNTIPICVIEDMWGSAVPFLKKMSIKVRPLRGRTLSALNSRICVTAVDQFAKKLLAEETKISDKNVFVTGGPQFDRVLELRRNWDKQRNLIRKNIVNGARVYLVAGGVNGTDEILDLVRPVLRPQDAIIFRQHSRSTAKDRQRTSQIIELIKQAGGNFLEVDKKIAPYTESLLPGADFVLSGFSTTNRYAIMLGIVGTIYVGTKSFQKDLWAEKKLKLPPEVEFGAGWYVQNNAEMKAVVEEVTAPAAGKRRNRLVKKQQKIAQFCDGKAVERVVGVISRLRSDL